MLLCASTRIVNGDSWTQDNGYNIFFRLLFFSCPTMAILPPTLGFAPIFFGVQTRFFCPLKLQIALTKCFGLAERRSSWCNAKLQRMSSIIFLSVLAKQKNYLLDTPSCFLGHSADYSDLLRIPFSTMHGPTRHLKNVHILRRRLVHESLKA